jgi:hypothetical protein
MPARLTLKTVNDEQRASATQSDWRGPTITPVHGRRGRRRLGRTVGVRAISSLTLKEWIAEFKRLKALNEQIMRTVKEGSRARR